MDTSWLQPVYSATGPFATVHLDASRNDENAAHEVELRWRSARAELHDAGAPDDLLDVLEPVVTSEPGAGGQVLRTVVATPAEGVLLERVVPGPPREGTSWGPLPDLLPLVSAIGNRPAYVLVLLDRAGADIEVWGPTSPEPVQEQTVRGATLHIRKVKVGGWAHRQYQQRSEELWKDNADKVAAEIDRLVDETGAGVLAVAGDPQQRSILSGMLGERARQVLVELEHGSRAAGASREALEAELEAVLARTEADAVTEVLEEYRQERGQHDRAVEGLAAVCEALRKAQVDTLLLGPPHTRVGTREDAGQAPGLAAGRDPLVLGVDEEDVRGLGDDAPFRAEAAAVLLRAAAASDAAAVVVPAGAEPLRDGVGAVLRYSDASTDS